VWVRAWFWLWVFLAMLASGRRLIDGEELLARGKTRAAADAE
jgi:hypothetical protein